MKHRYGAGRDRGRRARDGFTLVELMIVVGLIGIMAMLAINSLPYLAADARMRRAGHTFAALVREARGRALANRSYVALTVASTGFTMCEKKCAYDSTGPSDANNCPSAANDCTIGGSATWTGYKTIPIDQASPNSDYFDSRLSAAASGLIIFNPRGQMITGTTGDYVFTSGRDANRKTRVTLSAGGNVRVQ